MQQRNLDLLFQNRIYTIIEYKFLKQNSTEQNFSQRRFLSLLRGNIENTECPKISEQECTLQGGSDKPQRPRNENCTLISVGAGACVGLKNKQACQFGSRQKRFEITCKLAISEQGERKGQKKNDRAQRVRVRTAERFANVVYLQFQTGADMQHTIGNTSHENLNLSDLSDTRMRNSLSLFLFPFIVCFQLCAH